MECKKACTLEEIDKALKEKYNAKVFCIDKFKSLNEEISANPEQSVRLYLIDDENIIENNLSDFERKEILETIYFLKLNEVIIEYSTEEDRLEGKILENIIRGKLIRIIVESSDGTNFTGFTMQGSGEKIYNFLLDMLGEGNREAGNNTMDDMIKELNKFKPYGF